MISLPVSTGFILGITPNNLDGGGEDFDNSSDVGREYLSHGYDRYCV